MKSFVQRAISVAALAATASAKLVSSDVTTKTLVLLDNWATVETHSLFFSHLKNNLGHTIEYAMASEAPLIKYHDKQYFENIIMMTPSVKEADFPDDLNVKSIIEFLQSKDANNPDVTHNLMVFADVDARRHTRKVVNELGIDFEDTGSYVSD